MNHDFVPKVDGSSNHTMLGSKNDVFWPRQFRTRLFRLLMIVFGPFQQL